MKTRREAQMNKRFYFLSLILCLSVVTSAQASLKADAAAIAGRVNTWVQDTAAGVQTKINTAAQKFQESQLGTSIKAKIETIKAMKEDVSSAAGTIQDEYQETADNTNAIKDAATDVYEEQVSNFENSQTGKVTELNKQLEDVKKQMQDRSDVLSQELSSKTEAAKNNLSTMQSMYESVESDEAKQQLAQEMSSLEGQIAQYEDYAKQIENEEGDYLNNDDEYADLLNQKKQLESQIAQTGIGALVNAADSLISAFNNKSDEQRSSEYNQVIKENFLLPEEAETAENVSRVLKHRQEVLAKDTAHAFYTAAKLKLSLDADLERIKLKKDNMASVDYKLTSVNLLTEQKIEDIKILYNYTNLMLADMRLKTSRNMFNQEYRLQNYDKDPAALNLDNYIFTKDDVPTDAGEKSFLDKVTGE